MNTLYPLESNDRFLPSTLRPPPHTPSLNNQQLLCFQNAVRIILDHRAVLLNENTGTGKSYVAAAIAVTLHCHKYINRIHIIAPAHLHTMWTTVMEKFHCQHTFTSFQKVSRNYIEYSEPNDLFIIDEAHFLKNQNTNRYKFIHPILHNKFICMLTATPISTHYKNLSAILSLCGFPKPLLSSRLALTSFALAITPSAFGSPLRLEHQNISVEDRFIKYKTPTYFNDLISILWNAPWPSVYTNNGDSFSMKLNSLVPNLLIHRLLSASQACKHSLLRIKKYYDACIKCNNAHPISKADFHSFFGLDGSQLPLPFIFNTSPHPQDTPKTSILLVNNAINQALSILAEHAQEPDPKLLALLRCLTALHGQAVLFTQYADTAIHFEKSLSKYFPTALVTAQVSKIHTKTYNCSVPRHVILNMFDPDHAPPSLVPVPKILITTDTLSTGSNLQNAQTVIHIDLPWNPATIIQREGRVLRNHQSHNAITFFRFSPTHAPAMLKEYLIKFHSTLRYRSNLIRHWHTFPKTTPHFDRFLFIPDRCYPPCWGQLQDTWFPIHPAFFQKCNQKKLLIHPSSPASIILNSNHPGKNIVQIIHSQLLKLRHHPDIQTYLKNTDRWFSLLALLPSVCPDSLSIPNDPVKTMDWIERQIQLIQISPLPQSCYSAVCTRAR